MSEEAYSLFELVSHDPRYPVEAYVFVREALAFAADSAELNAPAAAKKRVSTKDKAAKSKTTRGKPLNEPVTDAAGELKRARRERHLTGQQLCEAIRQYSINQYGYMARVVLENWRITETSCFGDIVYNMIQIGIMKKSSQDRRSHFDNVYDFDNVFEKEFQFCCNSISQRSR